jgi:hypothetical protein
MTPISSTWAASRGMLHLAGDGAMEMELLAPDLPISPVGSDLGGIVDGSRGRHYTSAQRSSRVAGTPHTLVWPSLSGYSRQVSARVGCGCHLSRHP